MMSLQCLTRTLTIAGIGILMGGVNIFAEETTLTTYYPAPFGVYDTLVAEKLVDYNGGVYNVPPTVGADWFLDPSPVPFTVGVSVSGAFRSKVGIGTNTPAELLHVAGQGTGGQLARILVSSSDNEAGIQLFSDNIGNVLIYTPDESDDLRFQLNGTDHMAVTVGGNVGIGTTAPAERLEVAGSGTGVGRARLRINSTDNAAGVSLLSDGTGEILMYSPNGGNDLRFQVNGADQMTLLPNGRTVIGGNSFSGSAPAAKSAWRLEVGDGTNTRDVLANDYYIDRINKWAGDLGDASAGPGYGDGDWRISGSNMWSLPTGNVGIGTTSPAYKLDVNGTTRLNGATTVTGGNLSITNGNALNLSGTTGTQIEASGGANFNGTLHASTQVNFDANLNVGGQVKASSFGRSRCNWARGEGDLQCAVGTYAAGVNAGGIFPGHGVLCCAPGN